ncbi:MAG TPA: hypothetical protein VFN25_00730 [Dokdonella sp.]|uniref:hypothetical protein n=1 Tax=Dokdonella sp. TaxID=2291710 RepID=UPI002D80B5BA|nr:hypothetical protein [Dokdonella sp.]HET9031405.1 hypothetical protein [Dokdonella sp.]
MVRSSEKRGFTKRRIFIILLGVLAFWWSCSNEADLIAHRSIGLAFPDWNIYYGSISIRPLGGAWVSDVLLVPIDGDKEESYHFDNVSVEIPIFQFFRSAWDFDLLERIPAVKEVTLRFEGGSGAMGWPFSPELSVFGTASASPFEAEGCAEDGSWNSDELPGMGLNAKPTRLTMAWQRKPDRIVKQQSIETPGVGRVDYRGELLVHDKKSLLSLEVGEEDELALSEWHVVDEGFVAARNKFCANKDGISTSEFTARHLASVQRILAAIGMQARETTIASYRHFVENGGNLDLVVNYSPTIDAGESEGADWSRWLARTQGQLSVQGRSTALSLRSIDEQPFPQNDEIKSTWDIVRIEQERRTTTMAASAADERVPTPTAATADVAAPNPGAANSPPVVETAAREEILYAETDVHEERPRIIDDYAKLRDEVGQRFMLYCKGKSRMRVEIVGVDKGEIKIRRYLRSGWLEQGIKQASFERAERIR